VAGSYFLLVERRLVDLFVPPFAREAVERDAVERDAVEREVLERDPLRVPVDREPLRDADVERDRLELLCRRAVVFGACPLVAAFCSFSASRESVLARLRRFFRLSESVFSKSLIVSRPPRPSSLRRSLSATSAASSDFSRRLIVFGPSTLRPCVFAADATRREVAPAREAILLLPSFRSRYAET